MTYSTAADFAAYLPKAVRDRVTVRLVPTAPEHYALTLEAQFRGSVQINEGHLAELNTDARRNLINRALVELEHQIDLYNAANPRGWLDPDDDVIPEHNTRDAIAAAEANAASQRPTVTGSPFPETLDELADALRRFSKLAMQCADTIAPFTDERDPTPPHGTPRPAGYKWNDPPDEPHMICPECGGSGTYQRLAAGIEPRPCERCGTTGWATKPDDHSRTGTYCQSTRGKCVCKHAAGHTAGHECGCGEVWRSLRDNPQA